MVSQDFYRYIYNAFLVISILKISDAVFNHRCPVQSHWEHRADTMCGSNRSYFCLYDKNGNNFVEFCRNKNDFEAPGRKLVVAGSSKGTLQGTDCDSNFYQPFKFLSSGNSRCVYKKSYCNEEGQVVFRNGTENNDRSCRCDYTKGYDFITRPNHPCLCVPSKEDCSCYHKICPTKYILSPDYECLNENEWKLSFNCDPISRVVTSKDSKISSSTDNSTLDYHVIAYRNTARVLVSVMLMIIIILLVFVFLFGLPVLHECFYRLKRKHTDFETIPIQDVEEKVASIIAKSNLEKQVEANNFEKQKLMDEISKLKVNIGKVPHKVLELQKETLRHWSNDINTFVLTNAAHSLYLHIQKENVLVIIGPTGTGKSTYAYHIAFRLKNEDDYTIVPARQPSDILQYYVPGTNQVFVIDDFIGKYAFDETEGVSWEKIGPLLQKILSNNEQTKVILTCRKSIWHPTKYERFGFSAFVCDLHTKDLRLTRSEKRQIFEAYIDRGDVEPLNDEIIMMYTFFPSLCAIFSSKRRGVITSLFNMPVQFIEGEINNYEEKSQARYISLAVLAIKQKITKTSFLNDTENDEMIKTLFGESGYQTCPSKKVIISHLVALTDTYVKVDNDCFEFIHETMQNIVLYCIAKTFLTSVLKYCRSDVFKNQVRLACVDEEQTVPAIKVKSEHEEAYFTRLTRELSKRRYSEVFGNNQNHFTIFRKKWLVHLNKISQTIRNPSKTNAVGLSTVLHVVSSLGYEDYVSHFIKINTGIVDQADGNGNTPLHLASMNGHLETVKCLVEYSRNIHILNNDKVSPFFYACESNEILVVKYLINLKGDLVKVNETYMTKEHKSALHIACLNGSTQIVQILLDHQSDVDILDKNGLTPLHLTCMNGQVDSASLLIVARANVNALDRLQRTPLYYACTGNYKDIVELLIGYKADINQSTLTGSTPLHAACEKDGIEIATILIENLSNVNVKEKTIESPLHVACRHGNERMVNLLIDHSAVVNSKTKHKVTPLHEACSNGHKHVVDILLKKNVNYKQRTKNGWTALFFSCANGCNDIVKMLLNLETDVNISDSVGNTPLMLACKENHISVVETHLVSNANVAQCNKDKCSPLEYACTPGNTDIINSLLEHGANINWANTQGITPLHTACMNNHAHIVNVLIEKNADINSKDLCGGTPLHKACFNGDIEIVKILLNKGAKINITDNSGKSPVAFAKEKGFSSIVELLDNANTV